MSQTSKARSTAVRTQADKDFYSELGQRIAEARKKTGLTQATLSAQMEIGQQTYAHYESGHLRTPIWQLRRIAEILEMPYDTLIDGVPVDTSRSKRGPRSIMENMFLQAAELPRHRQKVIQEVLEAMLLKEAS